MRCTLRNKSTLLSTLLVLAVVFGKSRGTQLDIMPDQNGLMICNSSVVFTCTLKAAPPIAMTWQLNNTDVAECTATGCDPPFGLPSHHTTTFVSGTGGTVTELHINPVKLSDNYVIACTDGDKASIQTHVKVEALPLDVTKINHTDKTDVTVLTSCIFSPLSSVKFKLQNSKTGEILNIINNNEYIIPSDTEQCTNAENPNCGGNSTARAKVQFTISTQATGTPTDLQIITVQSDVSLTTPSIIGSFKLKEEEHVTTTQSVTTARSNPPQNSSFWCDEDLNQCVTVFVVAGGLCCTVIVAVVIIFTKGNTFIVRFENIPRSADIENAFQSEGLSITKSEHSRHSTVNRNCVVSTKNLTKKLPSTIQIGRITLKLSYVPGRKPFEYIYSVTEGSNEHSELSSPQNRTGSRPLPMPSNKNILPPIGHKMESVN